MDQEISRYLVRLRRQHPFLATLSMYANYQFTDRVSKFETDGRTVWINPSYFEQRPAGEKGGVLLHATLHGALLHTTRRGARQRELWNIAADIVVNDIISRCSNFNPPAETAVEPSCIDLSVEQVYAQLTKQMRELSDALLQAAQGNDDRDQPADRPADGHNLPSNDFGSADRPDGQPQHAQVDAKLGAKSSTPSRMGNQVQPPSDGDPQSSNASLDGKQSSSPFESSGSAGGQTDAVAERQPARLRVMQRLYPAVNDLRERHRDSGPEARSHRKRVENHWQSAIRHARAVDQLQSQSRGDLPAGLLREIELVLNPQLDWRTLLWRFITRTPCDFSGFDRRFVHRGLYLDQLEGDHLSVHIAVDTSGSIDDRELAQFRAEVEAATRTYHQIKALLYFVDADVHGPYPLARHDKMPIASGGGGTDFTPFFDRVSRERDPHGATLCIYLTDGDGDFPQRPPPMPVLWIVTADGVGNHCFPFGEVARLHH